MTEKEALNILVDFSNDRGVLTEPTGHIVSDKEWEAIDYLFNEWDYGYTPFTAPKESP